MITARTVMPMHALAPASHRANTHYHHTSERVQAHPFDIPGLDITSERVQAMLGQVLPAETHATVHANQVQLRDPNVTDISRYIDTSLERQAPDLTLNLSSLDTRIHDIDIVNTHDSAHAPIVSHDGHHDHHHHDHTGCTHHACTHEHAHEFPSQLSLTELKRLKTLESSSNQPTLAHPNIPHHHTSSNSLLLRYLPKNAKEKFTHLLGTSGCKSCAAVAQTVGVSSDEVAVASENHTDSNPIRNIVHPLTESLEEISAVESIITASGYIAQAMGVLGLGVTAYMLSQVRSDYTAINALENQETLQLNRKHFLQLKTAFLAFAFAACACSTLTLVLGLSAATAPAWLPTTGIVLGIGMVIVSIVSQIQRRTLAMRAIDESIDSKIMTPSVKQSIQSVAFDESKRALDGLQASFAMVIAVIGVMGSPLLLPVLLGVLVWYMLENTNMQHATRHLPGLADMHAVHDEHTIDYFDAYAARETLLKTSNFVNPTFFRKLSYGCLSDKAYVSQEAKRVARNEDHRLYLIRSYELNQYLNASVRDVVYGRVAASSTRAPEEETVHPVADQPAGLQLA